MDLQSSKAIKLTIDSRLEHVALVGLAIRSICSQLPLSPAEAYGVELSTVEAVNNVIKHAYGNQPGHAVEVIATVLSNQFIIEIYDTGVAMTGQDRPAVCFDPHDVRNLPEGGMGLHIIYTAMDCVEYGTHGIKNILKMIKRFEAQVEGERCR